MLVYIDHFSFSTTKACLEYCNLIIKDGRAMKGVAFKMARSRAHDERPAHPLQAPAARGTERQGGGGTPTTGAFAATSILPHGATPPATLCLAKGQHTW